MFLDSDIKQQLDQYLKLLEGDVSVSISLGTDKASQDTKALVEEIVAMSPRFSVAQGNHKRVPSFALAGYDASGQQVRQGVAFSGLPLGHEFNSLVMALLQMSGRTPKIEPELIERIKGINQELHFETFVSLTCHNCPDVVQALNAMSALNPLISHEMIDGSLFQEEVDAKKIMGVPAVFLNGQFFSGGRITLEEILDKLGVEQNLQNLQTDPYDVLVIGGGPAGASAAIYAARKGIKTGIVAEKFGGQVLDTLGVENLIGTLYTEGPKIADNLKAHIKAYDVDMISGQRVNGFEKDPDSGEFKVALSGGGVLKSKTLIIATGARWRNVGVPGEQDLKNKGVAYCPHCDGPLFKGKSVAVIGGGNSGIEAAIDLAGVVKHVTVLEFMPELKADAVLQKRLYSLPNVTVYKNVQTKAILGTEQVEAIEFIDRETQQVEKVDLEGVFVQIGLVANTEWLEGLVERNRMGEILVDKRQHTSVEGLFAAGDCTDSAYKQIVISMGTGATAALSAFDYLIRQ